MPDLTLGSPAPRLTVWLVDAAPFTASVSSAAALPAAPELVFGDGATWTGTLSGDSMTATWVRTAEEVGTLADARPRRVTLRDPGTHHVYASGTVYTTRVVEDGTPSGVAPSGAIEVDTLDGSVHITYVVGEGGGTGGVTDHGALTGLADDDHPQYLTEGRGDVRYDAAGTAAGLVGGLTIPSVPGDIGAQPAGDYATATHDHDGTYQPTGDYVTEGDPRLTDARTPTTHAHPIADVTGLQSALDGKQSAGSYAAATHTHDDRYYTEGEVNTALAGKADTGHTHAGYAPAVQTINAQTGTTYTLVAADAGKVVTSTNAAAQTITVPAATFTTGQRVDVLRAGAGSLTLAAGSGMTLTGTPSLVTRAQWSAVSVLFLSASNAVVIGDLATP